MRQTYKTLVIVAFIIVTTMIVGCATPTGVTTSAYQFTPPPTLPGMALADSEATRQTAEIHYQSTRTAIQQQEANITQMTRVSAEATAVMVNNATATAVVGQQQIQATAQSLVVQATTQALSIEGTRQANALIFEATREAASIGATAVAQERVATAEANLAAQLQATVEADQRRLNAELARQERWSQAMPGLIITAVVAALVGLALALAFIWQQQARQLQPVPVDNGDGRMTILIPSRDGLKYLPLPQRERPSDVPLIPSGVDAPAVIPSTAPWDRLIAWDDPVRVPIGIDAGNGRPILIDRAKTPHLLIAGTTGAGKTASGLRPYTTALWGTGAHVLVLNGKGSDFSPFSGWRNYTLIGNREELEMLEPTTQILGALAAEVQRRDGVLQRYNVSNWFQLPASAGESGEIALALDEMLMLLQAAETAVRLARHEGTDHKAIEYQVIQFWRYWKLITSQGRKYGIYGTFTLTDATRDAIGQDGMTLIRQMARVAFRMNSSAASRSLLDVDGSDGFNRGSAGLGNGRFIYNIGGYVGEGVSFYPGDRELRHYHQVRDSRIPDNPLPDSVQRVVDAVQVSDGEWTAVGDGNGRVVLPEPDGMNVNGEWLDGQTVRRIRSMAADGASKRAITSELWGYVGGRAHQIVSAVLDGGIEV